MTYPAIPSVCHHGLVADLYVFISIYKSKRSLGLQSSIPAFPFSQGPCLAWLNTIEAYQKLGLELPVNLKFIFEGMEESGSEGLDETVFARKDTPFIQVRHICLPVDFR